MKYPDEIRDCRYKVTVSGFPHFVDCAEVRIGPTGDLQMWSSHRMVRAFAPGLWGHVTLIDAELTVEKA